MMKPHLIIIMYLSIFFTASSGFSSKKVSITFDKYHSYTKTVKYLKKIAMKYPDITELLEIGRSTRDRPIYTLVISNMNTGTTIDKHVKLRNKRKEDVNNVKLMKKYQGKPALWISGSIHGNEFTGTEVCLYTVDKLICGYETDPQIKHLIDTKCFYFCPVINPDGLYNSIEKGVSQSNNSMKKDDDKDGSYNEDGPDDLNGDGFITQFRYKDEKGKYIIDDIDPRIMIKLKKDEKTERQRYSLITEDKDNDGDGKRGEDPESGIDLNQNFPEGWFKENNIPGGQGDYPVSSPEIHSVVEFFTNHRNILLAQFYHTSGGFTFRPMGSAPDSKIDPWDRSVYDIIMGKKYLEIIGEDIPEAWLNPDSINVYKKEIKKNSDNKFAAERGYEFPRGWRASYNEKKNKKYSYGMATDWAYKQYGIYSITTKLWNPEKDIDNFPEIKGKNHLLKRERALLKYQDENYNGELFISWKKFKHPELGEGEIGGWKSSYKNNAFPGLPLKNVCEKHYQFELFRASLLPEIEITEVETKILYSADSANNATAYKNKTAVSIRKKETIGKYKIVEVLVKIKNKGQLATNVASGATIPCNREDVIWLLGDRDRVSFIQERPFQKLGILEGQTDIPGFKGKKFKTPDKDRSRMWRRQSRTYGLRKLTQRILEEDKEKKQKGPEREVKWLIAVKDNTELKIVFTSLKGGTVIKKLSIK